MPVGRRRPTASASTAVRYFNAYGPRQALSNPYTGVAAIFSARLLGGQAPIIMEDGQQLRDFVHVRDVARATVAALDRAAAPTGSAINVGTGEPISINQVARLLAAELGRHDLDADDHRHLPRRRHPALLGRSDPGPRACSAFEAEYRFAD